MGGRRARRWRAGQGEHCQGGRHGWREPSKGLGAWKTKDCSGWSGRSGAQLVPLVLERRQPAPQVTASTVILREARHGQGCRENQAVAFTNELTVYKITLYSNLPPYLTGHLSVCLSLRRCTFLTLTCKYTTI